MGGEILVFHGQGFGCKAVCGDDKSRLNMKQKALKQYISTNPHLGSILTHFLSGVAW